MKGTELEEYSNFDGADNAVYDVFATTDEEFVLIFPGDTNVASIDEVDQKQPSPILDAAFSDIWKRRVPKRQAMGIHGILSTSANIRRSTTLAVAMKKQSIQTA